MAKLLVVGGDLVGGVAALILRTNFEEVAETSHDSALEMFLAEEPTHVIIFDYIEGGDGKAKWCRGRVTWQDIKSSADPGQVIVRCGFPRYDYPDYIQLPLQLDDLLKLLGV
jgi:hypothetical protein